MFHEKIVDRLTKENRLRDSSVRRQGIEELRFLGLKIEGLKLESSRGHLWEDDYPCIVMNCQDVIELGGDCLAVGAEPRSAGYLYHRVLEVRAPLLPAHSRFRAGLREINA